MRGLAGGNLGVRLLDRYWWRSRGEPSAGLARPGGPAPFGTGLDLTVRLAGASSVDFGGSSAYKTSGVAAWDGGVVSRQSFTGGAFCAGRPGSRAPAANEAMVGLTDAGAAYTGVFTDMDYAWFIAGDPAVADAQIYESGVFVAGGGVAPGAWTADSVFDIRYIGSNILYYHNGNLRRTVAAGAGRTFHLCTSHRTVDSGIRDLQFRATEA